MSDAFALYRLQEIELAIHRGQKRLGEITAALADDQTVAAARDAMQAAQAALTPLQTKAKNLELEIAATNDKMRAADEQLYSGRVRNPKELQDLQQEIAAHKRRVGQLEDTLLETMVAVEEAEARLTAAQTQLETVTQAWEANNHQLLDEQARLKAERAALLQQRQQALSGVDSESLTIYNALKPKKHNQPVAILDGMTCTACGVEQTMAIIGDVNRGAGLVKCLSCGRILAVK